MTAAPEQKSDVRPADADAAVGLVLGTEAEASTPLGFWVYVDPSKYLQLDDVVHVQSPLPDGTLVDLYGVVDEVRAHQEGASFTSDVGLISEGVLPAQSVVSAHVAVTRIEPELYVPPMPGQPVVIAEGEAQQAALFYDRMEETFPLGISRAGDPVYGNLQFLDGTNGAHVNISGISGVATKTSYATFLLHALFEGGALGQRAANAKAVIFNVKGEDLLFLDKPNAKLDDIERAKYERLGLPATPFRSAGFFAPVRGGKQPIPETGSRQEGVTGFFWTLRDFCERGYLRYLFADAESEFSQLSYVVDAVEAQLRKVAHASPPGANVVVDGATVGNFDDLVDVIEVHTDPEDEMGGLHWAGGSGNSAASIGTIRAFMRRLRAASRHVGNLIRGDEFADIDPADHRIDASRHQLTVVDIHRLHDRAQRFVVGVVLSEQMEDREARAGSDRPPPLFVVVDELNKYAPRDGRSPIKELLLDIAERGRSLGVIMIGAQQTASEVETRVVGQSAFRIVGRLDAAEAGRGEYRFLSASARERARLLKPGTMIISQPELPVPILVQFPRPAWATRPSEVAEGAAASGGDVFDRFDS
ncbi:MAG TPA: ATP-binding protein [Dehalococcoidia bacterium]|nr:ATP-binding protein [Dehalococcoidia bacterium]